MPRPPAESLEGRLEEKDSPETSSAQHTHNTGVIDNPAVPLDTGIGDVEPPNGPAEPEEPDSPSARAAHPWDQPSEIEPEYEDSPLHDQQRLLVHETQHNEQSNGSRHLGLNGSNKDPHADIRDKVAEELLSESPPKLTEVIALGDPMLDIH